MFLMMDRFVGYIYWFWPIICLLWPSKLKEENEKYRKAKAF
jgi:hypothetical protein